MSPERFEPKEREPIMSSLREFVEAMTNHEIALTVTIVGEVLVIRGTHSSPGTPEKVRQAVEDWFRYNGSERIAFRVEITRP